MSDVERLVQVMRDTEVPWTVEVAPAKNGAVPHEVMTSGGDDDADPSETEANPFHDAASPIGHAVPADGFEVLTARETCDLPDPPEDDHLLGRFVVRGNRVVVAAATGQGKTTFSLAALAAIVNKTDFLGYTGAGGRALVVDLEQGLRTVKRRLREAGLDRSDLVDYVRIPGGIDLAGNFADAAAFRALLERGYDVILLDPFYKAHRGDSNVEREIIDLMGLLDRWRSELGFALILPAHNRKLLEPSAKPTLDDVFGSSALVRGAEVVLGIQLVSAGYSRLYFLKDRDGDLPVGAEPWGLIFDQEDGYRRDPKDEAPERDLAAEIETFLADHPGSTTNAIRQAVGAGKERVTQALKNDTRFTFEPGPNNARKWVVRRAETTQTTASALEATSGGLPGVPPRRGGPGETTQASGGPNVSDHQPEPAEEQAVLDALEELTS